MSKNSGKILSPGTSQELSLTKKPKEDQGVLEGIDWIQKQDGRMRTAVFYIVLRL